MRRSFTVEVDMPPGVDESFLEKFILHAVENAPTVSTPFHTLFGEHPPLNTKVRSRSIQTITTSKALEFIQDSAGKFFSVRFIKRSNGEERYMVCRTGVKSGLAENPTKPGLDFKKHDLIPVFDVQEGEYRSIPIEGLREILIKRQWFNIVNDLA